MHEFFKTEKIRLLYKFEKGFKVLLPINESTTKNILLTIRLMKGKDVENTVTLMKKTYSKNNPFMRYFKVSEEDYGNVIGLRIKKSLEENLSLVILNSDTEEIIGANILFDVTQPIAIPPEINIFLKDMLNYQALLKNEIVDTLKKNELIKDKLIEIVTGVDDKYMNLGIVQVLHDAASMLKRIHNIKLYLGTFTNPVNYYVANKISISTNVKFNTIGIFSYNFFTKEDGSRPFLDSNFNELLIFTLYGDLNKEIRLNNSLQFDKNNLSFQDLDKISKLAYPEGGSLTSQAKL